MTPRGYFLHVDEVTFSSGGKRIRISLFQRDSQGEASRFVRHLDISSDLAAQLGEILFEEFPIDEEADAT